MLDKAQIIFREVISTLEFGAINLLDYITKFISAIYVSMAEI